MLAELAGLIHQLAARSKLATHIAIKAKRQCDAIIGARRGPSLFAFNGELRMIESVAPESSFSSM